MYASDLKKVLSIRSIRPSIALPAHTGHSVVFLMASRKIRYWRHGDSVDSAYYKWKQIKISVNMSLNAVIGPLSLCPLVALLRDKYHNLSQYNEFINENLELFNSH